MGRSPYYVRRSALPSTVRGMSIDAPVLEVTSHVEGKNAKVRVYADRVEWEKPKSISGAKMTSAILTAGMSAAVTGGVKSRKGAGTEVIPMRSITAVATKRDSMLNDKVVITTSGATIELRCDKDTAQRLARTILAQMNAAFAPQQPVYVQPVAPAAPAPAPVAPQGPPAGWYPDAQDPTVVRWYDGTKWTDFTQPHS